MFPAFEDGFEDIALVELGVAEQRDHAAFRPRLSVNFLPPTVRAHVILHQRREQRLRHAKPDRAGREIDVVGVFGARRIGLRAFIAAEVFELVPRLAAEQILNGVEIRPGMRLDRDAVLRPQRVEIKRGHDGRERGG